MDYLIMLFLMMFYSGVFAYCFNTNHLLLVLMSLEFMILSIYFTLYIYFYMNSLESFILLYFLIMSVSESVLGLSLLVGLIRVYGTDLYNNFNSLMC